MNRPGKPRGPHYLSHQVVDTDHGIILDVRATSGDVHDSVPYLEQLEHVHQDVIPVQGAAADAAYDFPLAHRVLDDLEIRFYVVEQQTHDRTAVELRRDAFSYDETRDVYLCPNGKELRLKNLHRTASGLYWEYVAERKVCADCPFRSRCLRENDRRGARKLEDSYFRPSVQRHLKKQNDPEYRAALLKRQIWCEGNFAAQKWGHNLTRILRRGIEAAEDHCLLSATALNLKRLIKYGT